MKTIFLCLIVLSLFFSKSTICQESGQPIPVVVKKSESGRWQLLRDGKPYYIRGAAGKGSLELLAACGANSNRTWGAGEDIREFLDRAHDNNLSVTVGIWLEHEKTGFDYQNYDQVTTQIDLVMESVNRFKNHPAVLAWGIGNEMEGYEEGDNPAIWSHIEHLARLIKEEDPNHPTMTVIAEIGGKKIPAIHKLCPSIDIIGINAYGGAASLPERYAKSGGTKPYIVTEFGPRGTWEVGKNDIGAIEEASSHEKAEDYRTTYKSLIADKDRCLGSYAFLWGNKQEATATWFGMLLPDGRKTAAVDTMAELWKSKPDNLCPKIESMKLIGSNVVEPGETVTVKLHAMDPEEKPLDVVWQILGEAKSYVTGGDFQQTPDSYSTAIVKSDVNGARLAMPDEPGLYRVYAFVNDGNGGAVSNLPIRVAKKQDDEQGKKVELPYSVYDEADDDMEFVPSGFMGEIKSISLDLENGTDPKSGKQCLKCTYSKKSGWGGVVWQHPEDDWGEKPGGLDLSGAKKMTFWARSEDEGLEVKFGFGLLGRDKKYFDTAKREKAIRLTREWKQYSFDLKDADLSRIKTGFFWSLAANGKEINFYLDKIIFEK